jgi:hypothetical protein
MTKHVRGSVQAALHRHQGEHLIEKLANKILGEFKQVLVHLTIFNVLIVLHYMVLNTHHMFS